jgi:hypothetical protein
MKTSQITFTEEERAEIRKRLNVERKTYDTMLALNSVVEHWIETEQLIKQDADKQVELNGPKWRPDGEDEISLYLHEQWEARTLHDEILIPMHRYSTVVMLCTTMERELKRMVENLEKERGKQKLRVNDLGSSNISYLPKVAKYLDIVYDIRLSDCPQYQDMTDLYKIRHCIVHCLGEVGLMNEKDKEYLISLNKKRNGFFALERIEIEIESECIKQFIEQTWEFFTWIFQKLNWRIDEYQRKQRIEEKLKRQS